MNVIISNYPEDLEVPQEYVANVTAAAQKVGELYIGGQRQEDGTYGSLTSSAQHKSDLFDGPGILKVGTLGVVIMVR